MSTDKKEVKVLPVGDTHSYRGWLNSDSFIKRAFAIYGYSIIAQIIVTAAFFALFALAGVSFIGMMN